MQHLIASSLLYYFHLIVRFFPLLDFEYVPRESNCEADELAQVASSVKMSEELTHKLIVIGKKNCPSIYERESY